MTPRVPVRDSFGGKAHRAQYTKWTEAELLQLRTWYEARAGKGLRLDELSRILGRAKPMISRKARKMGLSDAKRRRGRKPTRKYPTDEESRAAMGRATRERFARGEHPRGMLGKKHTPEHCTRQAERQRGRKLNLTDEQRQVLSDRAVALRARDIASNAYSRCNYGRREDLGGQFFRSRWEANYARFLNWMKDRGEIREWEYEAETFWFEAIRRGVRSYKPDFRITLHDDSHYFVEVKGWMDAKSKTKLARMAKYHPNVDLRLVGEKEYKHLVNTISGAIPGWERETRVRQ